MLKKITAVLFAVLILFAFSSCGSSDTHYTDSNGADYIVVRDGNSDIIINSSGKLCVYTLNENGKRQKADSGEYMTEYIDFNGQVVSDAVVETAEMRFTLPKGFTADDELPGYFSRESYNGEIFIDYTSDDMDNMIEAVVINCENLLENYGSENFSYEKYTVTAKNAEFTVIKQICTSSEYYVTSYYYFVPYDSGYYSVNCIISTDNEKKVNFDKFIESFIFK